ncbi:uncharacterized protein LOC130046252 [Ostrea edulis]|uniref:uncharacterized protein LOC130046252 n=1 Tax=Ostrea edulis TaxID=37623 RepID=UPI002094ED75|nr:uncharacterized protein LOC130046252 [Ostrea edulis]
MVPIRVLLLIAIPLIGIFLQKSSSKSVDEINHHVEISSDLQGDHELIRTRRDVDSIIADEIAEIEKRRIRRRRRGGRRIVRRKPGRKPGRVGGSRVRLPSAGSALQGAGDILGAVDSGLGIAQTVGDMNQGNDDNGGDY